MVVYSSPTAGTDLLSQSGRFKRESWATGLHVIATANGARLKQVLIVLEEEHTATFARTCRSRIVLNSMCRTIASFIAADLGFT